MSSVVIPVQEAEECVMLPQRKRAKCMDLKRILTGEKLCDIEIKFTQNLLKVQFKELNRLISTLYQEKGIAKKKV